MDFKPSSVDITPKHFILPTDLAITKQNKEIEIFNAAAKLDHHANHGTFDSTNQASLELIGIIKETCADGTSDAQRIGLCTLIQQHKKHGNDCLPYDVRQNFKAAIQDIFTQYPLACLLLTQDELAAIVAIDVSLGSELKIRYDSMTEAVDEASRTPKQQDIVVKSNSQTPPEYHMGFGSNAKVTDASHNGILYFFNEKLSY